MNDVGESGETSEKKNTINVTQQSGKVPGLGRLASSPSSGGGKTTRVPCRAPSESPEVHNRGAWPSISTVHISSHKAAQSRAVKIRVLSRPPCLIAVSRRRRHHNPRPLPRTVRVTSGLDSQCPGKWEVKSNETEIQVGMAGRRYKPERKAGLRNRTEWQTGDSDTGR